MRTIRIYTSQDLSPGQSVLLDEDAHRHVVKVLRMREGDGLALFNGDGSEYDAQIIRADKKNLEVEILKAQAVERESELNVTLCVALLKGEAMDFAVQKSVELGVKRIVPFDCARAERRLSGERAAKRMQHWQKIIISAAQQCGRTHLPELVEPQDFIDVLNEQADLRLLLSPHHDQLRTLPPRPDSVALLIGPEGGFEGQEVDAAIAAGWQALQLGPRILRADTAVVTALAVMQAQYGDLL
ncbi:16S rRNA (uracil(1498)-N(3))-methyltransferase [Cardiobacteriaceae bacterium TAE3-ERU3]|nr:16S rRNA (uracil(1498)-N(3))-methyltransferase [Cardiobacteriaceae bacterium TAE3-ERU3]